MVDTGGQRSASAGCQALGLFRAWCCTFTVAPHSPDHLHRSSPHRDPLPSKPLPKPSHLGSCHSPPSPCSKLSLGIIDHPRRILSPGKVSPIDSDAPFAPLSEIANSALISTLAVESKPKCPDPTSKDQPLIPDRLENDTRVWVKERSLDLRLCLKGKFGFGA